jgi:hypothetical protein
MGTDSVSAWLADPKEGLQLYENSKVSSSERAVKCLQVLLDRYRCPESFLLLVHQSVMRQWQQELPAARRQSPR